MYREFRSPYERLNRRTHLVRMFGKWFVILTAAGATALAACSGGSSGSGLAGTGGGVYGGGPPPTSPPQGNGNLPITQQVTGKPAFVNPSNNRTLYFLDVDTPMGGTCTGGCLSIWPPIVPNAQAQGKGGFTIVNRSDGSSKQWDYKNQPLYMYAGDSGPDQANGEGIPLAGGHWHVARPN
jgi:predicted lipoprotein with Yx(FWY)xxD motif